MSKRGGGSNPNFSFSGRHLALLGAAAEAGVSPQRRKKCGLILAIAGFRAGF